MKMILWSFVIAFLAMHQIILSDASFDFDDFDETDENFMVSVSNEMLRDISSIKRDLSNASRRLLLYKFDIIKEAKLLHKPFKVVEKRLEEASYDGFVKKNCHYVYDICKYDLETELRAKLPHLMEYEIAITKERLPKYEKTLHEFAAKYLKNTTAELDLCIDEADETKVPASCKQFKADLEVLHPIDEFVVPFLDDPDHIVRQSVRLLEAYPQKVEEAFNRTVLHPMNECIDRKIRKKWPVADVLLAAW